MIWRTKKKKQPLFDKTTRKPHPDLEKELDKVFSLYVRLRDCFPNGTFRCISCGKIRPFGEADCGHFFPRRHRSVRFDEDNCHAEDSCCNRITPDHLKGYRENLIEKIGTARFEQLEARSAQTRQYSEFELSDLIKHYKQEIKKLKKQKGL